MSLLVYPKVIPYTKFKHFEVIRFSELWCGQTDKQSDGLESPTTPTDEVGVENKLLDITNKYKT